ncbi:hypothetical protein P3X46_004711 [Hevea brasiliensis]|uniref:Pentacotripeptide-repeat region of PRORP domain-containing protein n=1 Tax=Hevea brasiliensis TaxID=3981 RepID=A0ABQ9MY53_HEVBR|nr:hypothetical protein P3X46_004711 [Hevea brasiliensis]
MIMAALRSIFTRCFHFQLLMDMGIIQSPSLLLFTNYFHCFNYSTYTSNSTHKLEGASSQSFLGSKFNSASFRDVDDALAYFNRIILMHPLPCIESHTMFALSILMNCFCRLHLMDFDFSILEKILKIGLEPNIVIFNTLINGLCIVVKINRAAEFFNDMVARGCQPDVRTYSVIVNCLCKFGKIRVATGLMKEMVERGCEPNDVTYNRIINALCKDRQVTEALHIFSQMKNKGI